MMFLKTLKNKEKINLKKVLTEGGNGVILTKLSQKSGKTMNCFKRKNFKIIQETA